MDSERYTKLFNYGYFLSKHEPEVLDKLLNLTKGAEEFQAPLVAGEIQWRKEVARGAEIGQSNPLSREIRRDKESKNDLGPGM